MLEQQSLIARERDVDDGPAPVITKVAVLGAVLGGIAGAFGLIVAGVVGGATVGAALMWWHRNVVRPIVEGLQDLRANKELVDELREDRDTMRALKSLPDYMRGADERFRGIEEHVGIAASASVGVARELGVKHRHVDPPGPPKL